MGVVFANQDAYEIGLEWYPGDPVSLSWIAEGVDWHGTYTAAVREFSDPDSAVLATFTVTAIHSSNHTTFTLTLTDAQSDAVPAGTWWFSCREVAGVTRFSGPVNVHV